MMKTQEDIIILHKCNENHDHSKGITFKCGYAKIAVTLSYELALNQPLDLKDLRKFVTSPKTMINVKRNNTTNLTYFSRIFEC